MTISPRLARTQTGMPSSAIFIGNSFFYYNNGINSHLTKLIAAMDAAYAYRSTMVTISGSGLDWHDVESYFRPGAIGRYSFDPHNNVVFNRLDKLFDVAIIMDSSQGPLHPDLAPVFDEYVVNSCASIRSHQAEPVLFMSWAYADKPDMTAPLCEKYTQAGNGVNALVIPAGLAFAQSIAALPGLDLYVDDKRHPSLAGTYLSACVTFAALFEKSPEGLSWHGGLDAEMAGFLQTVAWQTCNRYYESAGSPS